ncbi:MAG: hypothetical protein GY805_00640 [Chloroflexi bacterium]|nr:hypothetical protein [Chloroflexota bacterium]
MGWAMSKRITSDLVTNALQMAIEQRTPDARLLHYSDRGSQYTGKPYRKLLAVNKFDFLNHYSNVKKNVNICRKPANRAEVKSMIFFPFTTHLPLLYVPIFGLSEGAFPTVC